jgi:monomeric isocitrate dehydrogenase
MDNLPNFPEEPQNDAETAIKAKYSKILGSANPVYVKEIQKSTKSG